MIRTSLKSFFTFSKKELNGLLVFCFLLAAIVFAPPAYRLIHKPEVFDSAAFREEVAAFRASQQSSPARQSYNQLKEEAEEKEMSPEYFSFDPNGLPAASWSRLGLSARQIQVIKNYESKGGRFYRKEDLQKIYSISKEQFARLEPYIAIPETDRKELKSEYPVKADRVKLTPIVIVELNAADSAQLETIRGIGAAFASRIIKYRSRLGGFYRKEQLREVYGIDSVKYAQLQDQVSVDNSLIQKININASRFDDLKRYPYLSYKQMNAIIQYRTQHGPYHSLTDLKKIPIIDADIIAKLEPYIIFND